MPHIEIKARKNIYPGDARKIIKKGTVIGLLTTGKISDNAKKLLDDAGITWAENIPEKEFMESEAQEEG
jgi:RecB family endonuclease NucS